MNISELKASDKLIYSLIVGSTAYNLNIPTSDKDECGIFMHTKDDFLSMSDPVDEIRGDKDTTYYELRKFIRLASTCNPTVISLLFPYPEIVLKTSPVMEHIIRNRHLFITKKAKDSFLGYAIGQIHKAKGNNKRINNPQPKERPTREQFCRYIDPWYCEELFADKTLEKVLIERNVFPFRPVHLDPKMDLSKFHVAGLESVPNTYRLYNYENSPDCKGVFQNDVIVCQNIPKEDEWTRFAGLLIYNENQYESAVREWKQYWEWMENRNEARWIKQEDGTLDYDSKNMCHSFRLILSGLNILKTGEPIIRFEGEQRDFLMKIRNGEFKYEELMEKLEPLIQDLKKAAEESTLPDDVDKDAIEKLYKECYYIKNG